MKKLEQLYEGKAKKVFKTDVEDYLIVSYKDDATAFNGLKKGTISGKGEINNLMSNQLFQYLEKNGISTHFVETIDERDTVVKSVDIVPLEVIVRNVAAGSFSKRLGVEEGLEFEEARLEFPYKNDDVGDRLINDSFAIALKLASQDEIDKIKEMALKINDLLKAYFIEKNIKLIDFKLEFGRFHGDIILADEISPDTCRLWDKDTNQKLDKDRFRRDMGDVEGAYSEVRNRLGF